MSPISSKNKVPPSASLNFPSRPLRSAPVKAPGATPKNSASSKVSGTAAMLILTNGPLARGELAWMAWANNSLPVPVSPSKSTGLLDCAALRAWRLRSTTTALEPMKLAKLCRAWRKPVPARRCTAKASRASSSSRCIKANLAKNGCKLDCGWSNNTTPKAPMTWPASSCKGKRLTTNVPALLISRSIRIGFPVSMTCCIWSMWPPPGVGQLRHCTP